MFKVVRTASIVLAALAYLGGLGALRAPLVGPPGGEAEPPRWLEPAAAGGEVAIAEGCDAADDDEDDEPPVGDRAAAPRLSILIESAPCTVGGGAWRPRLVEHQLFRPPRA